MSGRGHKGVRRAGHGSAVPAITAEPLPWLSLPIMASRCNPFRPQSASGLLGIHLSQSEPQSEVCWSSTSGTGVTPTSS